MLDERASKYNFGLYRCLHLPAPAISFWANPWGGVMQEAKEVNAAPDISGRCSGRDHMAAFAMHVI
jgi:hypothetical protein